jgi:replicative DNA helicase
VNEQAEEILIGSILKDNSILDEIVLSPENFLDLTNQNIFRAMLEVKRKGFPIDGASLKDHMGETGFLFIGGNERLEAYKGTVASVHAFKSYEHMVLNQWKLATSKDLIQQTMENLNLDNVETLIRELSKIDEEGTQEDFNLKRHLMQLYENFTVESPKRRSGIPSGFLGIDDKTDGFMPGNLIIVGARPAMGKTAFLLNMAINAAKKRDAIPIIFSLEMTEKELLNRVVSCIGEINGMKMKNPYHYTNEQEKDRGIKAIGELEQIDLKIYDKPAQKVSEMRAKIRKIKHQNPDKEIIVFIDYLTLIKPAQDHKGNMHAAVTEISADLKNLAKTFDCPVVCLAQLSRGVEQRQDKRPVMSDLRESGSIEQDANVIMMLYRDEYYNETTEENRDVLEVDVVKNRDGEVGLVKLQYKKDINRIENFYHYHKQNQ